MNTEKKRRNTPQKQLILETLVNMGSHVSAGAIYKQLQETHPEIGRATVFRVLSEMTSDGILYRVQSTAGEDRFDITNDQHHHITCRLCGKVDDVWFDHEPHLTEQIRNASGFSVESEHIEFHGLCRECRQKNPETLRKPE